LFAQRWRAGEEASQAREYTQEYTRAMTCYTEAVELSDAGVEAPPTAALVVVLGCHQPYILHPAAAAGVGKLAGSHWADSSFAPIQLYLHSWGVQENPTLKR